MNCLGVHTFFLTQVTSSTSKYKLDSVLATDISVWSSLLTDSHELDASANDFSYSSCSCLSIWSNTLRSLRLKVLTFLVRLIPSFTSIFAISITTANSFVLVI